MELGGADRVEPLRRLLQDDEALAPALRITLSEGAGVSRQELEADCGGQSCFERLAELLAENMSAAPE